MFQKIAVAFLAIFLLSGCSSSSYKHDSKHIAEFNQKVGDRVFFSLNCDSLTEEAKTTLMRQAEWLNQHKMFCITVEGHCDCRGTKAYNIALGERRAETVRKFLVDQGVDIGRIRTISYGKERPAVIGSNKEAYKQNRRSVTVIK